MFRQAERVTTRPFPPDALERAARMLYPDLPAAEGLARIEAAIDSAKDDERWARIEKIARQSELVDELIRAIRLNTPPRRTESD